LRIPIDAKSQSPPLLIWAQRADPAGVVNAYNWPGPVLQLQLKNNVMPEFQCPCCDYFSLKQRGQYDICKVCFWEDDGLDLDKLDEISGPNHMPLREARRNFVTFGACDQKMLKNVIPKDRRGLYAYVERTC
jgi:hypothetical protein